MLEMDDRWLDEERFDFVSSSYAGSENKSPFLEEAQPEENVEEEVFFGPLTHTEKCIAAVVSEREQLILPSNLDAEKRALLLQESAKVSFLLKHNAPASKASPVAVVHPMQQSSSAELKHILTRNCNVENIFFQDCNSIETKKSSIGAGPNGFLKGNKENSVSQSNGSVLCSNGSKLVASKMLLSMRSQSQTSGSTTKLPKPRKGNSSSEFSKSLVDSSKLYGVGPNKSLVDEPVAKSSSKLPTKSGLLPSRSIPVTSKAAQSGVLESKLKPMKAVHKIGTSEGTGAVARAGSPVDSRPSTNLPTLQRPSAVKRRSLATTPQLAAGCQPRIPMKSNLTTPTTRPATSRLAMAGRQLLSEPDAESLCTEIEAKTKTADLEGSTCSVGMTSTAAEKNIQDLLVRYKHQRRSMVPKTGYQEAQHLEVEPCLGADLTAQERAESLADNFQKLKSVSASGNAFSRIQQVECDSSPLLKMSPPASLRTSSSLSADDPFETGCTPPVLMDVVDVLQPELPPQPNLIEF